MGAEIFKHRKRDTVRGLVVSPSNVDTREGFVNFKIGAIKLPPVFGAHPLFFNVVRRCSRYVCYVGRTDPDLQAT